MKIKFGLKYIFEFIPGLIVFILTSIGTIFPVKVSNFLTLKLETFRKKH